MSSNITDLTGRAALVTGASRGIGAAVAHILASHGATVAVHYGSNEDAAQQVLSELEGSGHVCLRADLSSAQAAAGLPRQAAELLGRLDIVINNAGVFDFPAVDLGEDDFLAVQRKMKTRGLRWLHRHGHIDDTALHQLDSSEHAGGWSVNAAVTIPDWDRGALERLVRYCARPPLSQERLGRLNDETLVYSLRASSALRRSSALLATTLPWTAERSWC